MNKLSNFAKNEKSYITTTDAVASDIRQAIIDGVFKGGQQLGQDELAAHLGVSRIPVREALRKLEAQGFVTFFPNRGVVVSALSGEEILEISQARILLEKHLLELSIPNMTAGDFQTLDLIIDKTRSSAMVNGLTDYNCEFHMALYRAACRPYILGTVKNMHDKTTQYQRLFYSRTEQAERTTIEHGMIAEACKKGNIGLAIDILHKHIEQPSLLLATQIKKWE